MSLAVPPLIRQGWAWEFLRRNPDYRRLYGDFRVGSDGRGVAVAMAGFRRWGVMFPGGSEPGSSRRPADLGSRNLFACPAAGGAGA